MWLTLAVKLLKSNWKPLLICTAIFLWSLGCYNYGKRAIRAEWEQDKAEEVLRIQGEKDRLQDDVNRKSAELEAKISELKTANKKLNARVQNEIRKNIAYTNCIVTNDGLQLYNDSAKSNTAR